MLRFAIPSKGTGYEGTLALLESCGLRLFRPNPRQYTASLRQMPETEVLLHRPEDIVQKVALGGIDIGVTGIDLVRELCDDNENLLVIYENLGFWHVDLVFAVPQAWIDVSSWPDLADLAVELQQQGRPLRIATKYPNLIRRFCAGHGIHPFHLIPSQGATEAAPGLGYADIIADITETGTALRDNQLKVVGGTILHSQACLVGSKQALRKDKGRLAQVRKLLDLLEARQRGRSLFSLVANVLGPSVEEVGRLVTQQPTLAGLQGPTIAPVWDKFSVAQEKPAQNWYAVNVIVPQDELLAAVEHLRELGASTVTVTPVHAAFEAQSKTYTKLEELLQ